VPERIDRPDFNDRHCPFAEVGQRRDRLHTVLNFRCIKHPVEQRLGRRIGLPRHLTGVGGFARHRHKGIGRVVDGRRRAGIKGERSATTDDSRGQRNNEYVPNLTHCASPSSGIQSVALRDVELVRAETGVTKPPSPYASATITAQPIAIASIAARPTAKTKS
jgi:hypothetical protein